MESMKDYEKELEESYKFMGDGENSTDELMAWQKLGEMMENKSILTVEISGIVNKGVIAMVEGIRGFIPASRLALHRVEDLNEWLGREVRVRVIKVDPENKNLLLSAREILKEERDQKRAETISGIQVGSVLEGTVESLQDYGAFGDIGDGISGLVHISRIAKERIKHPKERLSKGEKVRVKVISNKDGKIGLSIRDLLEDAEKKEEEEIRVKLPKAEPISTSLGDLLKNIKL
jgi:small subunit ribosomal protein S1